MSRTAGIALLIALFTCGDWAWPATTPALLGQLMTLLARRTHGEAEFEQTQYLAALRRPLRSSGVMIYDAPAHLEERTLEPHPGSAVLDGGQLILQSALRRRTLRLEDYPQIGILIDSIRAILAGDRAALERRFQLTPSGDLDHWELLLQPRAAMPVRSILIAGQRDAILRVQVQQSDGGHSLMILRPRQ